MTGPYAPDAASVTARPLYSAALSCTSRASRAPLLCLATQSVASQHTCFQSLLQQIKKTLHEERVGAGALFVGVGFFVFFDGECFELGHAARTTLSSPQRQERSPKNSIAARPSIAALPLIISAIGVNGPNTSGDSLLNALAAVVCAWVWCVCVCVSRADQEGERREEEHSHTHTITHPHDRRERRGDDERDHDGRLPGASPDQLSKHRLAVEGLVRDGGDYLVVVFGLCFIV